MGLLKKHKKLLTSLWADERGQSTTEYILILFVVVVVALQFKKKFQTSLGELMGKLTTQLNSAADETN